MRTAEKQVEYGLEAIQNGEDVKGEKGPSIVGILPSFDQVRDKILRYVFVEAAVHILLNFADCLNRCSAFFCNCSF